MEDPVLRAFEKATATHKAMLLPNGAISVTERPQPNKANSDGWIKATAPHVPSEYVHHGYRAATRELANRRVASELAGRVSEKTPPSIQPHAAEALLKSPAWQSEEQGRSAQQAQLNVSALDSAISAARQVSQQAWQNASLTSVRHAAEYATSDLKASGKGGAGNCLYHSIRERPIQPPPPPDFTASYAAQPALVQSPQLPSASVAESRQVIGYMKEQAEELSRKEGDVQLAALLMSWFNCGYQTGLRQGRT